MKVLHFLIKEELMMKRVGFKVKECRMSQVSHDVLRKELLKSPHHIYKNPDVKMVTELRGYSVVIDNGIKDYTYMFVKSLEKKAKQSRGVKKVFMKILLYVPYLIVFISLKIVFVLFKLFMMLDVKLFVLLLKIINAKNGGLKGVEKKQKV